MFDIIYYLLIKFLFLLSVKGGKLGAEIKLCERKDSIKLISVDSITSNVNIIIVNAVLPIELGHSKCPSQSTGDSVDLCQNNLSGIWKFVLHRNHRCFNCESELAWYVVFIENILSALISVVLAA